MQKMAKKLFVTEHPNGRTYGECVQAEISSVKMIDGTFVITLQINSKPKRMKREEALCYYTNKLRTVWNNLGQGV